MAATISTIMLSNKIIISVILILISFNFRVWDHFLGGNVSAIRRDLGNVTAHTRAYEVVSHNPILKYCIFAALTLTNGISKPLDPASHPIIKPWITNTSNPGVITLNLTNTLPIIINIQIMKLLPIINRNVDHQPPTAAEADSTSITFNQASLLVI